MGVIYKTTNLINNKIYIGKRTFSSIKFYNNKYYGSGKLIKFAVKKYGMENFKREILEETSDNNLLEEREKYWINFFNSNNLKIGYNLTIGGNCKFGRKGNFVSEETRKKISQTTILQCKNGNHPMQNKHHTEETKNKIRMKLKGRKIDPEIVMKNANKHKGMKYNKPPRPAKPIKIKIDQRKKISQFTLDSIFVRNWNSISEASRYTGINQANISRVCSGLNKKSGGYIWKYLIIL